MNIYDDVKGLSHILGLLNHYIKIDYDARLYKYESQLCEISSKKCILFASGRSVESSLDALRDKVKQYSLGEIQILSK